MEIFSDCSVLPNSCGLLVTKLIKKSAVAFVFSVRIKASLIPTKEIEKCGNIVIGVGSYIVKGKVIHTMIIKILIGKSIDNTFLILLLHRAIITAMEKSIPMLINEWLRIVPIIRMIAQNKPALGVKISKSG